MKLMNGEKKKNFLPPLRRSESQFQKMKTSEIEFVKQTEAAAVTDTSVIFHRNVATGNARSFYYSTTTSSDFDQCRCARYENVLYFLRYLEQRACFYFRKAFFHMTKYIYKIGYHG